MEILIICALIVPLFVYFFVIRPGGIRFSYGFTRSSYEKELLVMCLGDRAKVDRLIRHEIEIKGLSRDKAAEHALIRYRRDIR
jgi:hypothetical protein